MRVGNIFPTRNQYFDRNAAPSGNSASTGSIAPHGDTTRFTYTTPAGKKLILHAATVTTIRGAAGAPVGLVIARVQHQNSPSFDTLLPYILHRDNLVPNRFCETNALQCLLIAGQTLTYADSDASTGGTNEIFYSHSATEFDA